MASLLSMAAHRAYPDRPGHTGTSASAWAKCERLLSIERSPALAVASLPRRTALLYLVVASAWIVGSDLVVAMLWDANATDVGVNIAKGLVFVVVTAAVLYGVLRVWAARAVEGWQLAQRTQDRYEALVEGGEDLVAVLDEDGVITYASPSLERVVGWSRGDALGTRAREIVHPDDVEEAVGYVAAVRAGSGSAEPQVFRLLTPDGRWRHVELLASDLRHEPAVDGVVVHGRDVSDQQQARTRLEHAMTHDAVTGLPTRARFEDDLRDAALGAAARSQGLAVLVLDLDAFRQVNEAVGRAAGDDVLREATARLGECSNPSAFGRLGADEFALAVPVGADGDAAEAEAGALIQRLAACLAEPLVVAGHRLRLSARFGGVVVRRDDLALQALQVAETNLRMAKDHPDRVVMSALERDPRRNRSTSQVAGDLHDALDRGELELYYQPQFHLETGIVVGAEALMRWNHPTEGLLLPRRFLRDATSGTLLPRVTRFALTQATRQAAAWRDGGHPIPVSVNLTLGDLRRHSIVDEVLDALAASAIDPSLLRLELTEHTILAEPERSLQAMRTLRGIGVEFSIDDFGTGYSSLVHLRTLPVREIKIDKVFVSGMPVHDIDDAIVTLVVGLAHRAGLTVVAEGIEHVDVYELLVERGCDRGQGFLMSVPVPAAEMAFDPWVIPDEAAAERR